MLQICTAMTSLSATVDNVLTSDWSVTGTTRGTAEMAPMKGAVAGTSSTLGKVSTRKQMLLKELFILFIHEYYKMILCKVCFFKKIVCRNMN